MINIDDLVRQRLSNAEDRESTGSWLQMREMLDQKMPVSDQIGGFNWRRVFGIVTGVAVFASLTVGGYRMITSTDFRNGDNNNEVFASSGSYGTKPNSTGISSEKSALSSNGSEINNRPNSELNTSAPKRSSDHKTVNSKKIEELKKTESAQSPIVANNEHSVNTNNFTTAETKHANTIATRTEIINNSEVAHHNSNTTNQTVSNDPSSQEFAIASTTNENKNTRNNLEMLTSVSTATSANATTSANKTSEPENNNHKDVKIFASNEKPGNALKFAEPDNARVKTSAPTEPELRKDTFRKMTIVQRYVVNPRERSMQMIIDTISTERMVVDRTILEQLTDDSDNTGTASAKSKNVSERPFVLDLAAAQNAKLVALDNSEFVPLSNQKVRSRKTENWNAKSFNEVMRDVKFNLAQIRFYPGVIGGANWQKFGTGHLLGFHLGLTGQFTYGEQWSMMAELKYVQRKNNGTTLNDNYVEITEDKGQFLQRNVEHFFKFANLQSIEMPVSLRFAMGRLNLLGGLNMAYHFAVDAEPIKNYPEEYAPVANPDWSRNRPTIKYDDFKARFAFGGLIGISFQVSPSLQLDIRTVKTFFDTAPVNGSYKVSQLIYMPASFQISAGYRFSQKEGIPKAR